MGPRDKPSVDDARMPSGRGRHPGRRGILRSVSSGAQVIDGSGGPGPQIDARVRAAAQDASGPVFVRNVDAERAAALMALGPAAVHHPRARLLVFGRRPVGNGVVDVNVVTAGTADLPVADEVAIAACALGLRVRREADVGVAGLHRLLAVHDVLEEGRCTVALAGMEGALPPTVARLVSHPVIGVPTSVGYGASLGGLAAFLAMRFSGAPLRTVGVDQGVEAALLAERVLQGA